MNLPIQFSLTLSCLQACHLPQHAMQFMRSRNNFILKPIDLSNNETWKLMGMEIDNPYFTEENYSSGITGEIEQSHHDNNLLNQIGFYEDIKTSNQKSEQNQNQKHHDHETEIDNFNGYHFEGIGSVEIEYSAENSDANHFSLSDFSQFLIIDNTVEAKKNRKKTKDLLKNGQNSFQKFSSRVYNSILEESWSQTLKNVTSEGVLAVNNENELFTPRSSQLSNGGYVIDCFVGRNARKIRMELQQGQKTGHNNCEPNQKDLTMLMHYQKKLKKYHPNICASECRKFSSADHPFVKLSEKTQCLAKCISCIYDKGSELLKHCKNKPVLFQTRSGELVEKKVCNTRVMSKQQVEMRASRILRHIC